MAKEKKSGRQAKIAKEEGGGVKVEATEENNVEMEEETIEEDVKEGIKIVEDEEEEEEENQIQTRLGKMEILDEESFAQDPTNLTLIMYEEDHTIGNTIKHFLTKMNEVEFCGYNLPHPLEDKMLLRVQTKHGVNALDVVIKAFEDVEKVFDTIKDKFEVAYNRYDGSTKA